MRPKEAFTALVSQCTSDMFIFRMMQSLSQGNNSTVNQCLPYLVFKIYLIFQVHMFTFYCSLVIVIPRFSFYI